MTISIINKTDLYVPLSSIKPHSGFMINEGEIYLLIQDDGKKEEDGRLRCLNLRTCRINKYVGSSSVRPVRLEITVTTDLDYLP